MSRPPLILAYHGIADIPSRHDPARLFVSPKRFRAQLLSLSRRRYQFLRISEFAGLLHTDTIPKAVCALTFDDGSEDNATILAPILRELRIPATLYICPGLLGRPYPWTEPEAGIRFMSEKTLIDLSRDPLIEIGSHTREHALLADASSEYAYREMTASKRDLENIVGLEVLGFAYPHCKYSSACPSAAERAGYTSAVTCGERGGWAPFELRREGVRRDDGPLTFALRARRLYQGPRDVRIVDRAARLTRPYRHHRRDA